MVGWKKRDEGKSKNMPEDKEIKLTIGGEKLDEGKSKNMRDVIGREKSRQCIGPPLRMKINPSPSLKRSGQGDKS